MYENSLHPYIVFYVLGRVQSYFGNMAFIEEEFYKLWRGITMNISSDIDVGKYPIWDYPLSDKYSRVWESMQRTGFIKDLEAGIGNVFEGSYALFLETPVIKYIMGQRCGLRTAGGVFSLKPYAFVLPQNSPLKEAISNT